MKQHESRPAKRGAIRGSRGVTATRRARARRGITLVEMVVALGVMAVGLLGFLQSIVAAVNVARAQREIAIASEAGRQTIERMRSENFVLVFQRYNVDPSDDPGAAGSAPGASIVVPGLRPLPGAVGGAVGQIVFPTRTAGAAVALRENIVDENLGMPRDLNGDGLIDGANHANDYRILPVIVRFDWLGANGQQHVRFTTQLANF
jgi:type II secretory pathway pseudopilin PulG